MWVKNMWCLVCNLLDHSHVRARFKSPPKDMSTPIGQVSPKYISPHRTGLPTGQVSPQDKSTHKTKSSPQDKPSHSLPTRQVSPQDMSLHTTGLLTRQVFPIGQVSPQYMSLHMTGLVV